MKIGIIGTRGIPNNYGGFEQATEHLSAGLHQKGHEVFVYNSHNHPYQEKTWNGVHIIHRVDPENRLGTAGQFIYDLNCIIDARKRNFDILLFMGYTSSSIWRMLFPKNTVIVSNMDGLEWKRSKYSRPVQKFLKYAEKLAVKHSHFHIVDSTEIRRYFKDKYEVNCQYIPYGASLSREEQSGVLNAYGLTPKNYFLLMARMEPENNIEMVLQGFHETDSPHKFLVIGNTTNAYGKYISRKYAKDARIRFPGAVFDQDRVHTLRKNAALYFHGHSVGGTNPSLLEAMASKTLIAAHNNSFNKAILLENAFYFSDIHEVKKLIAHYGTETGAEWADNNFNKINSDFNWESVVDLYDNFLQNCHRKSSGKISFKKLITAGEETEQNY
jgi:glycosyltransferase involved in cell wall biosynthesis